MKLRVFALSCHPDDIEFMMGGTLSLLAQENCELHYMNLANGSCGTTEYSRKDIIGIRKEEARHAAELLGADFHESLVDDLKVYYNDDLIRKVTAVIRRVAPDVLLLPSPEDYMEDHMNTCRVAVTAAFCRAMPNYHSIPQTPPVANEVVLYHALPYGLHDMLRRRILPEFYIDVSSVMEEKVGLLSCHVSQKKWLDESQGLDSYLNTMKEMTAEMGGMSKRYSFAEGWRRHNHLGFCAPEAAPLEDLLSVRLECEPGYAGGGRS